MKSNKIVIDYKTLPDNFKFEDQFENIYNQMEFSNQNILINGKAGTGKTTLLEYFRINSKKKFCDTCFYWNICN